MYKKKGITLIETVVYLALLSAVSMIFMGSMSYYKQKQRELAYQREIERVKEFIILQIIKSSNEGSFKQLGITKDQVYDRTTKEGVKLSFWKIDTGSLIEKQIVIHKGKIEKNFKLILKGDKNDTYEIQNCTRCGKIHM